MTPDEVIDWLEAKGRADMYNPASPFSAAAQTVRAMRDALKPFAAMSPAFAHLSDEAVAVRKSVERRPMKTPGLYENIFADATAGDFRAARSSLSPKEGKT